jgi:hypothetical protein
MLEQQQPNLVPLTVKTTLPHHHPHALKLTHPLHRLQTLPPHQILKRMGELTILKPLARKQQFHENQLENAEDPD